MIRPPIFLTIAITLVANTLPAFSQLTTIVATDASGWNYLNPTTGNDFEGYDPASVDADFNATWFDPTGIYLGGAAYDGPEFVLDAQGPLAYGNIPGVSPNTILRAPFKGTRGSAYFTRVIDGGEHGFFDLEFDLVADDGAFIYLNGILIGTDRFTASDVDTWGGVTRRPEDDHQPRRVALLGYPILNPGQNFLAISVHNGEYGGPAHSYHSDELGLSLEIRGTPGPIPDLPPLEVIRGPYLQHGTSEGMTIRWRTQDFATSTVRYGLDPNQLDQSMTVPSLRSEHVVRIGGLVAGQKYYYAIESERPFDQSTIQVGEDSNHFFRAAPTGDYPTRIWAMGDFGTADDRALDVYQAYQNFVGEVHTDLFLMLGDNAYEDGTDAEYQAAVFDTYAEMLRQTVAWPTLGNHDTHQDVYMNIFSLPTSTSGTELYYSFDYANIHFVCLDSQTEDHYDAELGSGMLAWLEEDLMTTTKDWIIGYFHHGPYTKGSHDSDAEEHHIHMREKSVRLLEEYGVDLILSGHSHSYERSFLIDGHYGHSSSFNAQTMGKDVGNGSDIGGVDAQGNFVIGIGSGPYRKAYGGNHGAVYTIAGSGGSRLSGWANGSYDLVNPEPHPVMLVNLRIRGSVLIEVEGNELHARMIDDIGNVRDDYKIVKGGDPLEIGSGDETAWRAWLATHFEAEVLDDAGMEATHWGLQANPDQDDWRNEYEFYFGLNPLEADAPEIAVDQDSGHYSVHYWKNADAHHAWVSLQYSLDMNEWHKDGMSMQVGTTVNRRNLVEAKVHQPEAARVFFRFETRQNP